MTVLFEVAPLMRLIAGYCTPLEVRNLLRADIGIAQLLNTSEASGNWVQLSGPAPRRLESDRRHLSARNCQRHPMSCRAAIWHHRLARRKRVRLTTRRRWFGAALGECEHNWAVRCGGGRGGA